MSFDAFFGNSRVVEVLRGMVTEQRLPQTLLFSGPRGVGKATAARLLAAAANCDQGPRADPCGACSNCRRMIVADLRSEPIEQLFAERLKMPAAKRLDNPLIVSTHPDLLIFPPDGPLRMITIEQARRLRQAARFGPSEGRWRFFVVDQADRANEEAANSLLKTLEEPAPKLTIILTAENPYDLLPTIRSRAIPFHFGPLSREEMAGFFATRPAIDSAARERLTGWAQGSPGRAVSLDVEAYTRRREAIAHFARNRGRRKLISRTLAGHGKRSPRRRRTVGSIGGLTLRAVARSDSLQTGARRFDQQRFSGPNRRAVAPNIFSLGRKGGGGNRPDAATGTPQYPETGCARIVGAYAALGCRRELSGGRGGEVDVPAGIPLRRLDGARPRCASGRVAVGPRFVISIR